LLVQVLRCLSLASLPGEEIAVIGERDVSQPLLRQGGYRIGHAGFSHTSSQRLQPPAPVSARVSQAADAVHK
jgi:hypothetical protein